MKTRLEALRKRHRRIDRIIDNCRAIGRQEELKILKRIRLGLKDDLYRLQVRKLPSAG